MSDLTPIRILQDADTDELVALRREALLEAPMAFASSPEDDRFGAAEATSRLLRDAGDAVIFGAFRSELVGMVGLYRDRHLKAAHKLHLWGMYVRRAHRRRGVATVLLRELLDHARRVPGAAWVRLGVSSACPGARQLYEQTGFEVWGTEPDGLRHAGQSVDLCHMGLRIAQAHATREELEAGLDEIGRAPYDNGTLDLIARRPRTDAREVLQLAELDPVAGLVGDNWSGRGSRQTSDGSAHPEMQLTLMASRVAALVARRRERWPLAGDQLYVDLDLSEERLPPGTRLSIGGAVIEITAPPHTGCKKFVARFGLEAMKFVNSPLGRRLRLRGVHARVVQRGTIRIGDRVSRSVS